MFPFGPRFLSNYPPSFLHHQFSFLPAHSLHTQICLNITHLKRKSSYIPLGPYSSSYCCLFLLPPQLCSLRGMSPGTVISSSPSTLSQTLQNQLFFIHHFREMTLVRVTSGQSPGPAPFLSFLASKQGLAWLTSPFPCSHFLQASGLPLSWLPRSAIAAKPLLLSLFFFFN